MCSKKMRAANRRNAIKSTGPKSEAGKSRSSQNAITHGLSARASVVLDESTEEFDTFAQAVHDDFRPCGPMENVLVDRIVHLSWKLRRIPKAEAELFVNPDPSIDLEYDNDRDQQIPYVMVMDLRAEDSSMRRIQDYEVRLDRSLHATMRQLNQLRKMKRESRDDEGETVQAKACKPDGSCDGACAQTPDEQQVVKMQNEAVLMEPDGADAINNPLLQPSRCASLPAERPPDAPARRSA
ncbi:hypothetical protein BH09PLA1_BH09PLA1_23520 [soil metagenome]